MSTPRAADAFFVGAVKLLASAMVLSSGFRAVSDDDYARLVIAQRFAEAPSLDPSGTSWLPVPFWTYGTTFALFGNGLGVARTVALALGAGAAIAVLVAAHFLGSNRLGALLAAAIASVFPWSAWLGAAALPEAPTAGLIVLGIAALSRDDLARRAIGASALALAGFSRYEAWPVAVVFLVLTAVDARRLRTPRLAIPAAVAVLPVVLWLAHGAVRHGDALFFWKRVAAYKAALGGSGDAGVFEPLAALVRDEPLVVVGLLFVLVLRVRRDGARSLGPYARGFACTAAVIAFLLAGAAGGAAPTHHFARALLPVWYFLSCVLGHVAGPWLESRPYRRAFVAPAVVPFLAVLATSGPPEDFAHRELELHIGRQAQKLGAPALFVDTRDFGYFAVSAAFGKPNASTPASDRDPRKGRQVDPFESAEALRERLKALPGAWLVATNEHAPLAATFGSVRARNAGFTLVEPR